MSTILVVEDNPLKRVLVHDILEYRGFEVLTASNVDEARAVLHDCRPDLVLLDIEIPGGGGEAVLRTLRQDPSHARTPVVALTAYAMQGDRERFLESGFDGYFSKPIDTRTFAEDVERYLARPIESQH